MRNKRSNSVAGKSRYKKSKRSATSPSSSRCRTSYCSLLFTPCHRRFARSVKIRRLACSSRIMLATRSYATLRLYQAACFTRASLAPCRLDVTSERFILSARATLFFASVTDDLEPVAFPGCEPRWCCARCTIVVSRERRPARCRPPANTVRSDRVTCLAEIFSRLSEFPPSRPTGKETLLFGISSEDIPCTLVAAKLFRVPFACDDKY